MISVVAKIIYVFAATLQHILNTASFTGKIIVAVLSWLSSVVYKTLQNVLLFFQIVYEDNVSIITEELPNTANGVFNAIFAQLTHMGNGVADAYNRIYYKCIAIFSSLSWLVHTVFVMVSEVLHLFKNGIIFAGDTAWIMLTFIPVHLPQLIRTILNYVVHTTVSMVVDGYMALLKFTNFLTEVPFQSFLGITSVIVIVRLCVHFRETIVSQITTFYWSIVRNLLYLYYAAYNYFANTEVGMITQMAGRDEVGTRDVTFSSSEGDDAADSLCVICQERQKCVLTLPCRHVCLCTDCCRRLYGYQRTCPICRTFIYHSVTVYL